MKKMITVGMIFILLLPMGLCYSLRPAMDLIYFEPGLKKTISFIVNNNDVMPMVFRLEPSPRSEAFSGILDKVLYIREPQVTIGPGEEHEFFVDVTLPDSLPYGIHDLDINIYGDKPEEQKATILVKTVLGFRIKIYSLYPGKFIEARVLNPNSPNIGENMVFKTTVRNIGTEDIGSARAKIDVYSDNNLIGSVYSDYKPIASKDTAELPASLLITSGYKIGEYTAKASVEYDGKTEELASAVKFNVGELSMDIINITSRKFANNKINKLDIDVESKWNKPADVYADVILSDFSGVEKARFKTQTVTVEGWRKENVPAFFDVKGVENGVYTLKIILNYEGKKSEKQFAVDISEGGEADIVDEMPGMPKTSLIIIILLSTIIGLLVVIVLIFFLRGRKINQNGF